MHVRFVRIPDDRNALAVFAKSGTNSIGKFLAIVQDFRPRVRVFETRIRVSSGHHIVVERSVHVASDADGDVTHTEAQFFGHGASQLVFETSGALVVREIRIDQLIRVCHDERTNVTTFPYVRKKRENRFQGRVTRTLIVRYDFDAVVDMFRRAFSFVMVHGIDRDDHERHPVARDTDPCV